MVRSVFFTPDGKKALACGSDGTVRLWEIGTGNEVLHIKGSSKATPVLSIALSPDGKRLLCGLSYDSARVFDLESRRELFHLNGHRAVPWVAYSPDGRYLITTGQEYPGGPDGRCSVQFWDAATGKLLKRVTNCFPGPLAFTGDGRRLILREAGGIVRVWQIPPGGKASPPPVAKGPKVSLQLVHDLKGHDNYVAYLSISHNSRFAVTGSVDGTVRWWDLTKAVKESRILANHPDLKVGPVALSPDGKRVLYGGGDNCARLLDVSKGKDLHVYKGHVAEVTCVAYSPDGKLALTGSSDKTARIWDVDAATELQKVGDLQTMVFAVAFLPDSKRFLVSDGSLHLFEVNTGKEPHGFDRSVGILTSIAVSPDGKRVAGSYLGKSVQLWDVDTGKEVGRLEGSGGAIGWADFSSDGRYVVGVSSSSVSPETACLEVWDATTKQSLGQFKGASYSANRVAFTPDGKYLVGGCGHDTTLRIWKIEGLSNAITSPTDLATPKQPLPNADALAEAEGKVKEDHKADYAKAKTNAAMRELAKTLLGESQETSDQPALRFVRLSQARDLAAAAVDPALSLKAIDEAAKEFEFDALAAKVTALKTSAKPPITTADARAVLDAMLPVIEESRNGDRYDAVVPLLQLAKPLARTAKVKPAEVKTIEIQVDRVEYLRKEYATIKDSVQALAADPNNPEANLAVGKFHCFHKHDWDKGLPLLARGGPELLAVLAKKDLANLPAAADQLALGEGWRDQAKPLSGSAKLEVLRRAYRWYAKALPSLSDAEQIKAEADLADLLVKVPDLQKSWDLLDISGAKVVSDPVLGDVLSLAPKNRISTRQSFSGPLEITVIARTEQNNVRLRSHQGAVVIFNDVLNVPGLPGPRVPPPSAGLRVHRSGAKVGQEGFGPLAGREQVTLAANTWYTLRWRITQKGMEVFVNKVGTDAAVKDKVVFTSFESNDLSAKEPVRVESVDSTIEVKSLTVKRIKQ
jgi:WD40 repeat protein